jgi:two-component sensor histidine kinase
VNARGGAADGAARDATAAALDAAAAAAQAEPATILVVDDEPMARQMFTDLLEAQGFRVVSVARGEEVFSFLQEVDLVLLDAMLPGRDGWTVCREIKQHHDRMLPVIMVTARTAPEDVVRTFAVGADDYVAKPFHVAELIARIESRLRVHRAEIALKQAVQQTTELADQNYQLYDQARRTAEERSLLLRELDHRVRNNLSVIMGLVSMERNRVPPRPHGEALASLEHRLRSFLLVHEALRRQNYDGVPIREIFEQLAQRLRNAWDADRRIELALEAERVTLDEKHAFALALVVNELITNALRHAFPEGREGRLSIAFQRRDGGYRLEVADDGIGIAAATAQRTNVVGSGRSIIHALVKDELEGVMEVDSSNAGTRVRIEFPAD